MKLTSREKLLAANAIGNVKLAQTSESYAEAFEFIDAAAAAIADLKRSLERGPVAAVVVSPAKPTHAADGKGNVTALPNAKELEGRN